MPRIMTNPPAPGSPEWRHTISASKIPSMMRDSNGEFFGWGYHSAYELYHQMTGEWVKPIDEKTQAIFDDGHDIEPYALNLFLRSHPEWRLAAGYKIRRDRVGHEIAYTNNKLPFPNIASLDNRVVKGHGRGAVYGIVECKRPLWGVDELPNGWYIQVMAQMLISGLRYAWVVVVPRFAEPQIFEVEYSEDVAAVIVEDAEAFYTRLVEKNPPPVGASAHANDILASKNHTPKGEGEVTEEQMQQLAEAWQAVAEAEKHAATLENQLKENMGGLQKLTYGGATVVSRSAGRFAQSRVPESHRKYLKDPAFMQTSFSPTLFREAYPDVYAEACGAGSYTVNRKKFLKDKE